MVGTECLESAGDTSVLAVGTIVSAWIHRTRGQISLIASTIHIVVQCHNAAGALAVCRRLVLSSS